MQMKCRSTCFEYISHIVFFVLPGLDVNLTCYEYIKRNELYCLRMRHRALMDIQNKISSVLQMRNIHIAYQINLHVIAS